MLRPLRSRRGAPGGQGGAEVFKVRTGVPGLQPAWAWPSAPSRLAPGARRLAAERRLEAGGVHPGVGAPAAAPCLPPGSGPRQPRARAQSAHAATSRRHSRGASPAGIDGRPPRRARPAGLGPRPPQRSGTIYSLAVTAAQAGRQASFSAASRCPFQRMSEGRRRPRGVVEPRLGVVGAFPADPGSAGAHTRPSASPDSKEGPKRFKFHLS